MPNTTAAPLVTCVCLTTHPRRAAYLPDALRSYRQQTYARRELVVINDGAPLASNRADVRVVNLPPRGAPWTIGEKRNVGVRAARGEYLATWDDDDVSLPARLAEEVTAAEATAADVIRADGMYIADAGLSLAGRCQRGTKRPVMASALVRRDAAVRAGGYPAANYLEDAAMIERIRLVARPRRHPRGVPLVRHAAARDQRLPRRGRGDGRIHAGRVRPLGRRGRARA
ncbi:MAG: glycosyltransferase family A protein [Polyangiales bacterium]